MAANGYVVWSGESPFGGAPIVAILTMNSKNRKTGRMAQLWILREDISPTIAIATGGDDAICGACPLRGINGTSRACYVTVAQAPLSVWKAYKRGIYPTISLEDIPAIVNNRKVRLGAYGDPAMLPIEIVRAIVSAANGHTGYTHQWRDINPEWAHYLMASADNVADRRMAREAGYRSFFVVPAGTNLATISGAVECMATRTRNPLQCENCLACSGTRGRNTIAVDIAIIAHGSGAKYVRA